MMMRAIAFSSKLVPEVDHIREQNNAIRFGDSGYHPNPNGFWEPRAGIYPHDVPGRLIKWHAAAYLGWAHLQKGCYPTIWMVRDEQERLASLDRMYETLNVAKPPQSDEDLEANLQYIETNLILGRNDVYWIKVNYQDVINDPFNQFQRIADSGWPIDVDLAVKCVDPSLYRNRGNDGD
jgi:hypothetical protein